MSGVGIGWGCVNGFDRTSSVVDVTLKVLGWGGVGMCSRSRTIVAGRQRLDSIFVI